MHTLVFAYYCSGHGYGHATRVSAFARHLLSLPLSRTLTIHLVSSAPRHVFADSIACGALYRYADIDPVIVQPLAYRVDRQKSINVLEEFLGKKDVMLDRERAWLNEIGAHCVLSDAAFLGCLAAKSAGIPSILITNFTFDSVYSYLATALVDSPAQSSLTPSGSTLSPSPSNASISSTNSDQLPPDVPIPESTLTPLVLHLHQGYQHADLLLRLPGHIPIPSFLSQPVLPSPQWVNLTSNKFYDSVTSHLLSPLDTHSLCHPPKPFPNSNLIIPRSVRAAPLLVRPPSSVIYTSDGRAEFLHKIGLPNFRGMKILVVSFGGQVFKRPGTSRTNSRIQSRCPSQETLTSNPPLDPVSEKKPTSKRSSKTYHGFPKASASMDVLKPKDMNAKAPAGSQGLHLDLDAIDKGLRTHIKSKSSGDGIRHTTGQISHCLDENSDYASSDIDNEGSRSHPESDHEPVGILNKASAVLFDTITTTDRGNMSETTITSDEIPSPFSATTKRRHTLPRRRHHSHDLSAHRKLATPSHLLIPGAPPASKPPQTMLRSPILGKFQTGGAGDGPSPGRNEVRKVPLPEMCVSPPTPRRGLLVDINNRNLRKETLARSSQTSAVSPTSTTSSAYSSQSYFSSFGFGSGAEDEEAETEIEEEEGDAGLLPDHNWIAVICGVSKEQWNAENEEGGLPEGFYVAPRDVYMPDLIAVGDVVLGKLGYGMTSECVDACTPFVYVSRPLFIEEHGLRMYLDQEGVGVELSRAGYEGGEWARSVEEAYCKGWEMKEAKRRKEYEFCMKLRKMDDEGVEATDERRLSERERQGRDMARGVVEWVDGVRDSIVRGIEMQL